MVTEVPGQWRESYNLMDVPSSWVLPKFHISIVAMFYPAVELIFPQLIEFIIYLDKDQEDQLKGVLLDFRGQDSLLKG